MDVPVESNIYQSVAQAANYILQCLPALLGSPKIGIICGSGLGGLADAVDPASKVEIEYGKIPHFPRSTVEGHIGKLLFGHLGNADQPVVLMVGRVHFYEGHAIHDIGFPIRVLKLLGVDTLIVTNAAGGLNPNYDVGDIVVLNDHLNLAGFAGINPLRGPNIEQFGVRFPPLSDAYDLDLRRRVHRSWRQMMPDGVDRTIHEGVYAFGGGPSYETRAECRMLHILGADVVGMSTVPEIIVARHCGMRVLALSLVTNKVVSEATISGNDPTIQSLTEEELLKKSEFGKANHQEVLDAGRLAALEMQLLVTTVIKDIQAV